MIDDTKHRELERLLDGFLGSRGVRLAASVLEAQVRSIIGPAPDAAHICGHRYGSLPKSIYEEDDRQGIRLADVKGRMTLRGINSNFETIPSAYAYPHEWMSIERREL